MKTYDRIFCGVISLMMIIFAFTNLYLIWGRTENSNRAYRVEIGRIAAEIEENGTKRNRMEESDIKHGSILDIDLSDCEYLTAVVLYTGDAQFFDGALSDYAVREINEDLYRFDYDTHDERMDKKLIVAVNMIWGMVSALVIGLFLFVRIKILKPFAVLLDVPYELSRGNLTIPIEESKSGFFGRFLWGMDLLREKLEQQKEWELAWQKKEKTLILSLSHDIKTPLSAIKLYAKALSRGLYDNRKKQIEIAETINVKADEIEGFISRIISASRENFITPEVEKSEFYLSELINKISVYYQNKLSRIRTGFYVGKYLDCILIGDFDRSVEVFQNIIENAVKYGDGHVIEILFDEEDDCQLITVKNSGCTLPEIEFAHIFDSFWRGSNVGDKEGSGLGLYICRQLMHKMGGDIFADRKEGYMLITMVFKKV